MYVDTVNFKIFYIPPYDVFHAILTFECGVNKYTTERKTQLIITNMFMN